MRTADHLRCRELNLPHQVDDNTSMLGTPFTITVDKLEGCTTGVSANDRAATLRHLADRMRSRRTSDARTRTSALTRREEGCATPARTYRKRPSISPASPAQASRHTDRDTQSRRHHGPPAAAARKPTNGV